MILKYIKYWLLNRQFVKDYTDSQVDSYRKSLGKQAEESIEEIRKTAFKYARADLEETMIETDKDKIEELADKKLNDLLSKVDLTKIVTIDKQRGLLYIGGEKADELTLTNLRSEAEFLEASNIWRLLYETPKELAQRTMFVDSESLADLQKGKSILYTLGTQKNIINVLKSYQPKK